MSIKRISQWLFAIFTASLLLNACTSSQTRQEVTIGVDATLGTLVTAEWLSQHIEDPDLVVLDCTVQVEKKPGGGYQTISGRSAYEEGHIPTAGFADLKGELSDSNSSLQFAVPSIEQFSAAMGALGVGNDTRVVLYANGNSAWAARVWWMLRWAGFDRAALLDGGLNAWSAEGRELSTEPASHPARTLTTTPRPELIANRDEVYDAISNNAVNLVDALPAAHFKGEMAPYGRKGHIPGASNTPASSLLNETGHYRPIDELAALLEGDRNTHTITYCGGGISASSDAFTMTRLGFTNIAVYTASLQEWAADPDNPMVTDTP